MKSSLRSYDFLWFSLGLAPLIGLSFLFSISVEDYWWYLRLGRDILANGSVPLIDTLSFSHAGESIFYLPWLSGVILWVTHHLGGASLTFFLRGLLIVFTYGLTWMILRENSGPRFATLLIILMGLCTSSNWSVRPQLFAYPLFVLCVWVLYRWQNGNNRYLFLLPAAILLWANLHGSFALAFLLTGSAFLFGKGDRKKLFFVLVAMFLAVMINPRGATIWRILISDLGNPSNKQFSTEWLPTTNVGWQVNIFFGWILLFPALIAFSKKKLSTLEWVWFLGFAWLAFSGIRFVIWFMFLLAIFTSSLLGEWAQTTLDQPNEQVFPAINYSIATFLFAGILMFLPGARESWWQKAPPAYDNITTPLAAADWLSTHSDLPGQMWNDYGFGSYLEFALPARAVWIDTRTYHYPLAEWMEYTQVSEAQGWQEMFDREKINLAVLSVNGEPKLISALSASPLWREEYRDQYVVIFLRTEPIK